MSERQVDDALLEAIAQGILEASDEDIIRVARERGVDSTALRAKVRAMIEAAGHSPRSFAVGEMVALRSDASRKGVVTGVTRSNRETRYSVFIGDRLENLYASQLEPATIGTAPTHASLEEFQASLTALQLTDPSLQTIYSLQSGRIDYIPYQFRPVMKFIRADRPRLLLADEVGVGKTIEAGLLLRELQARRPVRSAMIVCSKSLVVEEKWQKEMRRFDEEFVALDGTSLRYCIDQTHLDGDWPDRHARVIVPFSLFNESNLYGSETRGGSRRLGLLDLETPPRLDLLIVDEAHNARNADTHLHQGLRFLADNAEAVVLVTATPVQLGEGDLFAMLNLLRPDLVIDRATFARMAEPNPHVNEAVAHVRAGRPTWRPDAIAALESAAQTDWGRSVLGGSPEFRAVARDIQRASTDEERVRLVRRVEDLQTFSGMINRTRRRDIGAFTTRKPQTVPTPFTPAQEELHEALLRAQAQVLAEIHGPGPLGFLMSTIRRQAASSLHGLRPFIDDILERRLGDVEGLDLDDDLDPTEGTLARLAAHSGEVRRLADALPVDDPKLERLLGIVTEKLAMPNPRLLVFSSFRHTIAYLDRALRDRGVRVGVVHGGIADDERRRLRAAFAAPSDAAEAVDVLLSSEVGSEGLDFQFCDAIVNYDIPWNPMRIEQRIGRIDRYGQRSETVAIYNLVTPGTVDFDIYTRCLARIGVFERCVGGSEAILGEISRRIQAVADDFTLSREEREARLQQLADNEVRAVAESEALEEREAELFGVRITKRAVEDDIAAASSRWLEPQAIERLVNLHLEKELGMGRAPVLGQGPAKTLRLAADARRKLGNARRAGRVPSIAEREWDAWLRGDQPNLPITFEREAALADRSLTFITPAHPLTQVAAAALAADEEVRVAFCSTSGSLPEGDHPFAIYQWRLAGLKEDALLVPVLGDPMLAQDFMELLARGAEAASAPMPPALAFDALDGWHHELWSDRLRRHRAETADIANFRRESLAASHHARMATLREQLQQAREGRIQRMRNAQIARADAEYREALVELAAAEARTDIIARRVASGVVIVERPQ